MLSLNVTMLSLCLGSQTALLWIGSGIMLEEERRKASLLHDIHFLLVEGPALGFYP